MNSDTIRALLARAAEGEDITLLTAELEELQEQELAEAIEDEREDRDYRERVLAAQERTQRAKGALGDACANNNDWGDNDALVDAAADDYIRAQDDELKVRDPESYHERRQMGLL